MPYTEVMPKFKAGTLHSGSDKGPVVKDRKQAIAIMLSEKKEAAKGKKEYQAHAKGGPIKKYADGGSVDPPSTQDTISSYNPTYDRMPKSTNIQDERMGPKQDMSKPFTIDADIRVDKQGRAHGVVSKEGRQWAAKNLPKKLPTTPMKDDKAELGDVKLSPAHRMAGMEVTKYPSGLKADYVPYQRSSTPEQLKADKEYQKTEGPNVFSPPEAYVPPTGHAKGGPVGWKRWGQK